MADGKFLELLHSVELGRRNLSRPSMAVDYDDVERAVRLDEVKKAHADPTQDAP